MRENRGPWYLLTGLLIGLIVGLVYSRLVEPVQYVDVAPNLLSAEARDTYRVMIAMAYDADGNLGRARQRLALLNDSSPAQALSAQAQRMANQSGSEGQALAVLAEAYNPKPTAPIPPTVVESTLVPSNTPTLQLSPTATIDPGLAVRTATLPPTMTPTNTPEASITPRPTLRPTPTLGAPYAFSDKQAVCDPDTQGMLAVEVYNKAGEPVPGVQIRVTWPPNGVDTFYTGLALEINPGYADFQMAPNILYAVRAGENGEVVSGLAIKDCSLPGGSESFQGGVKIIFTQP